MNSSEKEKTIFRDLLIKSMDGQITPPEVEQFNALLTACPDLEDYYVKCVQLQTALREIRIVNDLDMSNLPDYKDQALWNALADAEKDAPAVEVVVPREPDIMIQKVHRQKLVRKISKSSWFSLITSVAAMLLVILFTLFAPVKGSIVVARLSNTVNARWEDPSRQIVPGCDLFVGSMNLLEGLAEIVLDSGAVAVIEAPAQFTLESSHTLYLQRGRLVVKINQASNEPFVIRSPNASIVDYGTEFGVLVDGSSNTLTHVYQGKVELRAGSNPLRFEKSLALTSNQAGQADVQGQLSKKSNLSGQFVRPDEFDIRLKASKGSGYNRWLAYSLQLRKDPSLAAYYTFEKEPGNPDILVNVADATYGSLNGRLDSAGNKTKPTWSQGQWPEKTALAFDRSQRQYVEVAADARLCINGPITIAAWIYCAGAKDGGHIVSNRVPPRSVCNYQLGYRSHSATDWDHNIHLARKLKKNDDKNQVYSQDLPDQYGWIMVAATHDNETLKFYLNGDLVNSQQWPQKQELVEAGLLIGSDYAPDDYSLFNGKIGEIIIARRVFTGQEIAEMYQAGRMSEN